MLCVPPRAASWGTHSSWPGACPDFSAAFSFVGRMAELPGPGSKTQSKGFSPQRVVILARGPRASQHAPRSLNFPSLKMGITVIPCKGHFKYLKEKILVLFQYLGEINEREKNCMICKFLTCFARAERLDMPGYNGKMGIIMPALRAESPWAGPC